MKRRRLLVLAVVLALLVPLASSNPGLAGPPSPGIEKLKQDAGGDVEITWDAESGNPSFIRGRIPLQPTMLAEGTDPATVTMVFVGRYAEVFGISDPSNELQVVQSEEDVLGMTHVTLRQVYQGVEVYNAQMKVHLSAGGREVVALSSGFVPGIALSTVDPQVSADQALAIAERALPSGELAADPKLTVYPGAGSNRPGVLAHLAWLVELRDDSIPERNVYVVDAIDGNVLDVLDRLYEQGIPTVEANSSKWLGPQRRDTPLKLLSDGQFPYGVNVENFDVAIYLSMIGSPLTGYASLIDERAHWYSINPRVLLAMLETQAGFVTAESLDQQQLELLEYPESTFEAKLEHLTSSLAVAFYRHLYRSGGAEAQIALPTRDGATVDVDAEVNAGTFAIVSALAETSERNELSALLDPSAPDGFVKTYRRLFPDSNPLDESNVVSPLATPPADMLQLPFAVGDSWIFYAGPHDWGGDDTDVRAFLDFGVGGSGTIPGRWVAAAAGGAVTRYDYTQGSEDCWVDIRHPNGWATRYYHVANLQVTDGISVTQNTLLGNPSELTCNRGTSGGVPHVHFGIMQPSGVFQPISGTVLSGWRVVETGFYDGYLEGPEGYGRRNEGDDVRNLGVCGPTRYQAEYYNNRTLAGDPTFERCEDAPIAYDWGYGGPGNGVSDDNFSVRWTGWFTFTEDYYYTFAARVDDGIRVWVDENLIVDEWQDQPPTDYRVAHNLSAGQYEVKVEYYEHGGGAVVQLDWQRGRNRETYDANHSYSLPGTLTRSEGDGPTGDLDVDNAHDFAGDTHNYYYNTHGRKSYDDQGATIVSTVHYGSNYNNAFWNGSQMVYGDGFPVKDVVAHELTHAVTEHSANLEYRWQSGALNESFSDVFGAMVDRDDWLMGEDLPPDVLAGRDAIRDLSDPSRFGQPDHTDDWVSTCSDNEGVHTNSGITNKAYYNIATDVAVGKEGAERIFYRALTIYLHPTSSLEDARAAALQSAQDLYPDNSDIYDAVENGFNAVGLDGVWNPEPNDCCGASIALAGEPDEESLLSNLRAVRDQVFTQDPGRRWVRIYYEHQFEVAWLLMSDGQLRADALAGFRAFDPVFRAGLGDNEADTAVILTPELIEAAERALMGVAERGSPAVHDAIVREWEKVAPYRFVGWDVREVWEQLRREEQPNRVYLPLVLK
jgi:Zn-dependent metalloprotease